VNNSLVKRLFKEEDKSF